MKAEQIIFIDEDEIPCAGIKLGNNIICACCGGVVEAEDVDIIEHLSWVDFSDFIK